jgi:hypothetical protein
MIKLIIDMNKVLLTLLLLVSTTACCFAQMVAEDASGQSSVIFKASSVDFNFSDAQLSANWNNFRKLSIEVPQRWIWGLSASAKNKDGTGGIFKGTKIVPDSKLSGFIGIRSVTDKSSFQIQEEIYALYQRKDYKHFQSNLRYKPAVTDIIRSSNITQQDKKDISSQLTLSGDFTKDINVVDKLISAGKLDKPTLEAIKDTLQARETTNSVLLPIYADVTKRAKKLNDELTTYQNHTKTKVWTWYLHGGLNANTLDLYNPLATGTLESRFDTVKFRGGFVDLGANYDVGGRWTLGASVGYEHFNNIDSLTSTDYSLKTSTTSGNEQLSSSKNYTAYPGPYIVYDRANIKTDILYWAKISKDYRLVWNVLYTRWVFPIMDGRINRVVNSGTALNFYKASGKFAGGVYLQSNDTFDTTHSGDPFTSRLAFGIVAKFSFDSIVDRNFN